MQRFRVDLKTFLGLAMPNQCFCAVKKFIFGGFLGGIFGQEIPNPIYSTTELYDKEYLCILCNFSSRNCFVNIPPSNCS